MGHAVGSVGGLALRSADRHRRFAARRHGQGRQDLPSFGRSRARHPARACPCPPGDRSRPRRLRPHRRRHQQPGEDVCDRGDARPNGHVRLRRPRRRHRGDVGCDPLARGLAAGRSRGLHALGQYRDARPHVESVVEGLYRGQRRAHHEPQRAVPAVAGCSQGFNGFTGAGADVRDDGVPAAQSSTRRLQHHRPSSRHGVPAAVLDG